MSNSLEERLRSNSSAFDSLLALIPAKYYYDEKTQDQWKAKKKSKNQSKMDKMKKLDPENNEDDEGSSALEVLQKKSKDAKPVVLPGERFKQLQNMKAKEEDEDEDEEEDANDLNVVFDDDGNEVQGSDVEEVDDEQVDGQDDVVEKQDIPKKNAKKQVSEQEKAQRQKNLEELRAKLQNRIKSMKEKRRAPGTRVEGAPSSREAILIQRKKKDETKKQKKELQSQQAGNDSDSSDEEIDNDIDNDVDSEVASKKRKLNDNLAKDIMFQNIIFDDGDRATSDLQRLRKVNRKAGPSKNDIKAHLKILETKKAKLESKDELEQIKYKEKEKWQKTMLQAEGVKLRNDEKLLRKALKRKEAKKRKSSVEWQERKRSVAATISERAKRREENLQIRKDNKGKKRSQQTKMKRKYKGSVAANLPKKQKRAGFEGNLKSGKKN